MSRIENQRAFVVSEGEYIAIIKAGSEEEARRIFRQRLDAPDFAPDVDFQKENKH
jgi:hypothetical protein